MSKTERLEKAYLRACDQTDKARKLEHRAWDKYQRALHPVGSRKKTAAVKKETQ